MVGLWNDIIAGWADWMWAQFWQTTLLVAIAFALDRSLRRVLWPQLRLGLWMLIVLKLCLPPGLASPISVSAGLLDENSVPFIFSAALETTGLPHEWVEPARRRAVATGPSVLAGAAFAVWIVGAALLLSLFVWRYRRLAAGWRQDAETFEVPAWLQVELRAAMDIAGMSSAPPLVITNRLAWPAVFGIWRATLLMPAELLSTASRRDLRHMLLHELAHVARRDLWMQSLTVFVQVIYWFNPLAYFVRRQTYGLRELCCDATVAVWLRERTVEYRATLLRAIRCMLAGPARGPIAALGLLEGSENIVERVRNLEQPLWRGAGWCRVGTVALLTLLAVTLVPMGGALLYERCHRESDAGARKIMSAQAGEAALPGG